MIILGDTVFDADLKQAYNSGYSCLGVKEVDDPRRFGVVISDEDGFITKLVEKPTELVSNNAIVGIYYITNTTLLKESLNSLINRNIKTAGEYQLTDALQIMIEKGEKFRTFNVTNWYDCGKPVTLLSTNRYLLEKNHTLGPNLDTIIIPPVYIAPNAMVERSVIGPYATVADNAIVVDSVVRDSIISDGATVSSSLLEKSIIGNNAIVRGRFYTLNVGNSSEIKQI
jgi:glucose-1-phosphate thymidylyltransferase